MAHNSNSSFILGTMIAYCELITTKVSDYGHDLD